jgi:hypothetical protein
MDHSPTILANKLTHFAIFCGVVPLEGHLEHLSSPFKQVTGLRPTQSIITKHLFKHSVSFCSTLAKFEAKLEMQTHCFFTFTISMKKQIAKKKPQI